MHYGFVVAGGPVLALGYEVSAAVRHVQHQYKSSKSVQWNLRGTSEELQIKLRGS